MMYINWPPHNFLTLGQSYLGNLGQPAQLAGAYDSRLLITCPLVPSHPLFLRKNSYRSQNTHHNQLIIHHCPQKEKKKLSMACAKEPWFLLQPWYKVPCRQLQLGVSRIIQGIRKVHSQTWCRSRVNGEGQQRGITGSEINAARNRFVIGPSNCLSSSSAVTHVQVASQLCSSDQWTIFLRVSFFSFFFFGISMGFGKYGPHGSVFKFEYEYTLFGLDYKHTKKSNVVF